MTSACEYAIDEPISLHAWATCELSLAGRLRAWLAHRVKHGQMPQPQFYSKIRTSRIASLF